MKQSVKVIIQYPEDHKKKPKKRMEIVRKSGEDEDDEDDDVNETEIGVHDRYVQIDGILPLIIMKNSCLKVFPPFEISWVAIL